MKRVLKAIVWFFTSGHRWKYRNPYARECTRCGRHENVYGYIGTTAGDTWDEIYPLAHSPKLCE